VVEIGAGQGVLTREIASKVEGVIAIELDQALVTRLRHEFPTGGNVTVLQADALTVDPCELARSSKLPVPSSAFPVLSFDSQVAPDLPLVPYRQSGQRVSAESAPYKLAGNIPYYITGALLRRYLTTACKPSVAVLMVQLEVARRMLATPGEMNLLAVSAQLYTNPSIVLQVPPRAFRPPPKVDSALVKLDILGEPRVSFPDVETFFAVARAGFSTRRKQLVNALALGLPAQQPAASRRRSKVEGRRSKVVSRKSKVIEMLEEAGIEPTSRAQDLSLMDWGQLSWAVAEARGRAAEPQDRDGELGRPEVSDP